MDRRALRAYTNAPLAVHFHRQSNRTGMTSKSRKIGAWEVRRLRETPAKNRVPRGYCLPHLNQAVTLVLPEGNLWTIGK